MSRYINLANVRNEEQKKVMQEIATNKHCPFCAENLNKYHKNPIIKEGDYWLLTENQWPYPKVKQQLLAIYKTHIEHISDINSKAFLELMEIFKEESAKREVRGGGIVIRFGSNPEYGNYGSSVLHIHAHLIEPNLAALDSNETFKVNLGKPKDYISDK